MTTKEAFGRFANRQMWCGYVLMPKTDKAGNFVKYTKPPVKPFVPANQVAYFQKNNLPLIYGFAKPNGAPEKNFGLYDQAKKCVGALARKVTVAEVDTQGKATRFEEEFRGEIQGIGLKLGPVPKALMSAGRDPNEKPVVMAGVDIDDCRNPETGELSELAQRVLNEIPDTYAEVSVSGTGIHLLMTVDPETTTLWNKKDDLGLEMYVDDRYFTISENPVGEIKPITHQPEAFARLQEAFATEYETQRSSDQDHEKKTTKPRSTREAPNIPGYSRDGYDEYKATPDTERTQNNEFHAFSDSEQWDRMEQWGNGAKIARLRRGDCSDFPSKYKLNENDESRAAYYLLNQLAYATRHNPNVYERMQQMESMFTSTGIESKKWNAERAGSTWGRKELENAVDRYPYEPLETRKSTGKKYSKSGKSTKSRSKKAAVRNTTTKKASAKKSPAKSTSQQQQSLLDPPEPPVQQTAPAAVSTQESPAAEVKQETPSVQEIAPKAQEVQEPVKAEAPMENTPPAQMREEPARQQGAATEPIQQKVAPVQAKAEPAAVTQGAAPPVKETPPAQPTQPRESTQKQADLPPAHAQTAPDKTTRQIQAVEMCLSIGEHMVQKEGTEAFIAIAAANPSMSTNNQLIVMAQIGAYVPPDTYHTLSEWKEMGCTPKPEAPSIMCLTPNLSNPAALAMEKSYAAHSMEGPVPQQPKYSPQQILAAYNQNADQPNKLASASYALTSRVEQYVNRHKDYQGLNADEKKAASALAGRITTRALGLPDHLPEPVQFTPKCNAGNVIRTACEVARRCVQVTSHAIEHNRTVQVQKGAGVKAKEPAKTQQTPPQQQKKAAAYAQAR